MVNARELFRSLVMDEAQAVPVLAAALRREHDAALDDAAKICDEEQAEYWTASRAFDATGNHFSGAAEAHGACASKRIGERIRALIPPVAAPAAECTDHWHCDPAQAAHACKADRSASCPSCRAAPAAELGETGIRSSAHMSEQSDKHAPAEETGNVWCSSCGEEGPGVHRAGCPLYWMPDAPPSPVAPAPLPGPWRIGSHYGIHVYEDQRPVATFHTVLDAKAAVRAYNASLATPAPAPVAERIAELEEHLRGAYRQNPKPPGDWACAECRPDSELTAKGFRCWWHVGESLARAATTEGEGT